ncbi:hypothetical protein DFH06DRAFT_1468093 [Mycena polygramma]|nr:hypothetical protein DFH06DRAFT_1468093 [Mycena polygramma]
MHFKSSPFPTSDAYSVPFLVFNRFPKDIGLEILAHCSPFDLAQLGMASKTLRGLIWTHGSLWIAAQGNVSGEKTTLPPLPVVTASGNYSQSAYALFIFGGGSGVPNGRTFSLVTGSFVSERVRELARRSSDREIQRDISFFFDITKKYDNFSWGKWLPRVTCTMPSGEKVHSYSTRDRKHATREREQAIAVERGNRRTDPLGFPCRNVAQLEQECIKREQSRPALQQNALDLEAWKKEYVQAKAVVSRKNFEFIKKYSTLENRKFQGIMRCPTTARIFTAFNRDLDLVTHSVWIDNRAIILAELKAMLNGVLPEGTTGQKNDKLRCSYCPRLIAVKGMADHIVDKHKDQNPDKIPSIPSRDEKHCPRCPDSKRLFTRRGLRDHNLSKHSTPSS